MCLTYLGGVHIVSWMQDSYKVGNVNTCLCQDVSATFTPCA